MCWLMRLPLLIVAAALAAGASLPAGAAPHKAAAKQAAGPTALGKFDDWTAARYESAGHTVCYAFTRIQSAQPAEPGRAPLLTVTERAASRDEVALTTAAAYPKGTNVTIQVGQTGLDFYTSGSDAFARDGKAAVEAFKHGDQAIARSPGGRSAHGTDTFSLKGFTAAYEAITKACPAH